MLCSVQWILPFIDSDGNSSEGMFIVLSTSCHSSLLECSPVISWQSSCYMLFCYAMLCSVNLTFHIVLSWNVRQLYRGSLHAICYFVMLCCVQWILPFINSLLECAPVILRQSSCYMLFCYAMLCSVNLTFHTALSWNARQLYRGSLHAKCYFVMLCCVQWILPFINSLLECAPVISRQSSCYMLFCYAMFCSVNLTFYRQWRKFLRGDVYRA